MQDFFESLNNIYRDADSDPELRGWFKNIDTFIRYVNVCSIPKGKSENADSKQQVPA